MNRIEDNNIDKIGILKTYIVFGALFYLVVPCSYILSIFFDWGYFYALDISFEDSPTTKIDHLNSWLTWFPIWVGGLIFAIAIKLNQNIDWVLLSASEPNKTSHEPTDSKQVYKCVYKYGTKSLIFLVPLLILMFILGEKMLINLVIAALAIALIINVHSFFKLHVKIGFPEVITMIFPEVITMIFLLPVAFLVSFWWGLVITTLDQATTQIPTHRLYMKTPGEGSQVESEDVILLRSFQNSLLIREWDKNIRWIDKDQVVEIKTLKDNGPRSGFLCKYRIYCPKI